MSSAPALPGSPAASQKLMLLPAADRALRRLGTLAVGVPLLVVVAAVVLYDNELGRSVAVSFAGPLLFFALVGWFAEMLLRLRRTVAEHVRYGGQAPVYEGTLATLLRPRANVSLLHVVLLLCTLALYWAGAVAKVLGPVARSLLGPFGDYLGLRHRLRQTRYAGHTFDLVGPFGPYLRLGLMQWLLGCATFGALYGDYAVRKRRYLFAQVRWAGHAGHYDGHEAEARRLYLRGIALCVVTLGIYVPWHLVALRNYHLSRVSLGGVRLVCAQEGGSYFSLVTSNQLANIFTLGLACGWSYARRLRYQLEHLHFVGALAAPLPGAPSGEAHDDGGGLSDLLSGTLSFEN